MYVVIDERADVVEGYAAALRGEGVVALGFAPADFRGWFGTASKDDIGAVHCFLLGEFDARTAVPEEIRSRTGAGIIALAEVRSLETTLELFSAGIDDVVRKPVHVREIMARAASIWRRTHSSRTQAPSRLRVYFDGRDAEVDGVPLALPRRERKILEFLVRNAHRRVTKTQIFNAVYGIFEDSVDEVVVEGHISKLRRKLRLQLGHDAIDAKRYLGYQFIDPCGGGTAGDETAGAGRAQGAPAPTASRWLEAEEPAAAA